MGFADPLPPSPRAAARGSFACVLLLCGFAAATAAVAGSGDAPVPLTALLAEAARNSPALDAARQRALAARARVAPAGALDDPMFEAGIVNAALSPLSLRREDMSMQMVGLGQRLPFPGKRALRSAVAEAGAAAQDAGADDAQDRLIRDIREGYEELATVASLHTIVESTRTALAEYVSVAEARYATGSATQSDILQADAELARVRAELLALDRRRIEAQMLLAALVGRDPGAPPIVATPQRLTAPPHDIETLMQTATTSPRFIELAQESRQAQESVALARREYYPDVDLRLQYGRRERSLDGLPRDDMITLTFAVNLPVWRRQRLEPRVAEARAMVAERAAMERAQALETRAQIARGHAAATQARRTVELCDTALLPTSAAAVNATLAAYRNGQVGFATLLEARLKLHEAEATRVAAIGEHNRAVAELDYLTGHRPGPLEETP
ncbi:MAG: TolC family protein [Steroidobacteraceae bacterium]